MSNHSWRLTRGKRYRLTLRSTRPTGDDWPITATVRKMVGTVHGVQVLLAPDMGPERWIPFSAIRKAVRA